MKKWLVILFCTLVYSSCKESLVPPDRLLPPEQMQKVLWDVLEMQALAEALTEKDTANLEEIRARALTQKVFRMHRIDSTLFNESYQWYLQHPPAMSSLLDSLFIHQQKARTEALELGKPILKETDYE